jgi:hypothetical protein
MLIAANIAWQYQRLDWYQWFFGPYLMGCLVSVIVGMGIALSQRHLIASSQRRQDMLVVSLLAWSATVVPCLLLQADASWIGAAIIATLGLFVGQVLAAAPPFEEQIAQRWEWGANVLTLVCMLIVALAQWLGISPLWYPR